MDWFLYRTAAVLFILGVVVVEINSEFRVQVRDYNTKNGTIKWNSIRRQKREWIKFAAACREGEDNSKRNPIAKIHSDCAKDQQVTYRISGVGIDQPPFGVFIVNPKTGEINITAIVDREVNPYFIIYCRALNAQGQDLENILELRVRVLDINDNPPVFSMTEFVGSVEENSYANTLVMVLNATDADEPNNLNSKIAFKIISQEPADSPMFILNRYSGELRTMNPFLDREKYAMYSLVVKGSDRDGGADGLSAQSDCKITILDVNDNFPKLEFPTYSITIDENMISQEVTRFRVIDMDQEGTDNWLALFFFISGNEGGWFEIVTDEMTNEGIFRVIKPLNYEEIQNMQLSIGVRNKAEFHHSVIGKYKIEATAISVIVQNVIEGSVFAPASNTYIITRGMGRNSVVGSMVAIDLDTGGASKTVRYIMGMNPGGLLAVNERTGQLILNNVITKDVYRSLNGHYEGTILSIDGKIAFAKIKAFAYADEDESRPSNDCLLIYDIEGVGSSAGSIGCCSFIGEDEDDSYLDTLGPKFKKLADISLGKEIDSYPDVDFAWPPENTEPKCPPPGNDISIGHPPMSPHFGTTTVVSESTYPSGPGVQHPMPIPDPLGYGNVTVTESYTTSGSLQPPVHIHDPRHGSNVVVTERVVGPISGSDLPGMLDLTDFREGSNVVVTERVIAPNSRLATSLSIPDPRETSNVVVTERVIRPTSGLMGNRSIHPDLSSAHNVVVTERVVSGAGVTGISGGGGVSGVLGSNVSRGAITMSGGGIGLSGSGVSGGGIEMSSLGGGGGGLGSIGLNSSGLSGSSTLGHVRNSDHFNQTIGSASPSTTRSRITKYSTIQYSKQ
ncbi:desmoglein-1 [Petaurus breviceps papuanus]|uniref:desmoglein-1 n=1 Tax=Petaurus breviceps papuanus TaxID=3040969 RepID=UPI0036DE4B51